MNAAKLALLIRDLRPTFFITLNDNPHSWGTVGERARELVREFQSLRRRWRRWMGAKIDFVAVFEATRRGEPHLHVAVRCDVLRPEVLQATLLDWLGEPRGSRRLRVRRVYDVRGLASYMSKDPHKFEGCKRFWASLGWRVRRLAHAAAFALVGIVARKLGAVERQLRDDGFEITSRSARRFKFLPP